MHNKQAGGIVSFVVVAIALTGLLVGGLYLSKQQGRVARDNDTSGPQISTVENETKKTPGSAPAEAPASEDKKPADKKPAPSAPQTTPQTSPQPSTPTPAAPSTPVPPTNRVATTGPSDEIPETGPAETIAATIMLGALAFTSYRLLQSRRGFHRAALHR